MNPNQLTVAAIQMTSTDSIEENLQTANELIQAAKQAGADVMVLPEYFCLMGQTDQDKVAIREDFGQGRLQDSLSSMAKQHQIHLIAGTIPLSAQSKQQVRNTSLVFDPNGQIISRYDKIHLFGFKQGDEEYQESKTIEPGSLPCSFSIQKNGVDWKFGITICYDIRFPELYRQIGPVDCHIVSAAFTHTTGKAHWEILLRARAIENQSYLLASAQSGQHTNGRKTWGQSMLIDPWGEIQAELKEGEGFTLGILDKSRIVEIRAKLPSLQHRTI
jgi:nitrilase